MLGRRRRAGLQAEPPGPRAARQPQLVARRHRPRHLRPVPHPDPARHQRGRPARDYRLFLGHVDYRPDVGLIPTARCSSARTPTGSSSSATSKARDTTLDMLRRAAPLRPRRHRPDRSPPDPRRLRRQRQRHDAGARSPVGAGSPRDRLRVGHPHLRRPAADRPLRAVHASARGRRPDPGPHFRSGARPGFELGRRMFADFDHETSPTAIFATSDTTAIGPDAGGVPGGDRDPGPPVDRRLRRHRLRPVHDPAADDDQPERRRDGPDRDRSPPRHDRQRSDRSEVNDVVLSPRLVVRGSTAPPFR